MKQIQRGAEAVLYLNDNGNLIKERIKKGYRIKQIDHKLRKFRTRREAKILRRQIVPRPKVISVDETETKIEMEFLKGNLVRDILNNLSEKQEVLLCREIGKNVAVLHDHNIIHGDLTTSNMILKNNNLFFIDFGLGFTSEKIEDKAVDMHLLKQALEAKYYNHFKKDFKIILGTYKQSKTYPQVVERLKQVESRGRYKKR